LTSAAGGLTIAEHRRGSAMRRRALILIVALFGYASFIAAPASADTFVQRFKTLGFMSANFGDCPDTGHEPSPGTVCHDAVVQVFREAASIGAGDLSGRNIPWAAVYFDLTATFLPDGQVVETDQRFGYQPCIPDSAVTYDQQHLAVASVVTDIALDYGSTIHLDLDWQAISDREVYGSNGPSLGPDELNLIHHYVDDCTTLNNQAHRKLRHAAMTGTVDGQLVRSYVMEPSAYISYNHFVFIDATHGPRCA
jgi:hypothetical protein